MHSPLSVLGGLTAPWQLVTDYARLFLALPEKAWYPWARQSSALRLRIEALAFLFSFSKLTGLSSSPILDLVDFRAAYP